MLRFIFTLLALAGPALAQDAPPFAAYHSASEAVLNDPHDMAFGSDGNLYIADKFGNRVVVMDPKTLEVLSIIGDGEVPGAHDVSFGTDGRLYVSATSMSAVVVYDLSGPQPERAATLTTFSRTEGVLAHSNGTLYVMASGTGNLVAVRGDEVIGTASGMIGAHDVAEAPDGTIWVADNRAQRLVHFNTELEQIGVLSGARYGFIGPRYLDIEPSGILVVADQDTHRVLRIDPISGDVLGVIGSGSPGLGPNLLDDPEGVAIRDSEYFFADSDNNRIVKYVVVVN